MGAFRIQLGDRLVSETTIETIETIETIDTIITILPRLGRKRSDVRVLIGES